MSVGDHDPESFGAHNASRPTDRLTELRAHHANAEVILNSEIDIPLDRIAREFRKRAGRAFGLGQDAKAKVLRDLCDAIAKLADAETQQ